MLRKARRNLFFYPPKHGDPPPTTSKVIAPLCHPLLLRSPSLRSTQRSPPTAALQYYSTTPCIKQGGRVARYRSLCSVLYSGGERLPTDLCVFGFVQQGRGGSLLSPVFGFLYNSGKGTLYRPLCADLYSRGGQLSTVPCICFYLEAGMTFEGGCSVRYLPLPLVRTVEVE